MKRLFIALEIDETIRRLLCGLGSDIPGARPVPEEQLHLTLRFIGEVDGAVFRDIRTTLHEIDGPAVTMAIKGVGFFPPRGLPRVLWAGIEAPPELMRLRNRVNRTLQGCGIEPEQRKFHPHITLARLNNSPPGRVARFLAGNNLMQTPPFSAEQLILFSSTLTRKGAVHAIEAIYPLRSA